MRAPSSQCFLNLQRFIAHRRGTRVSSHRIPQLESAPVSDKTCWASPLPRQLWHGGEMWPDKSTTSTSVARILDQWILYIFGQLKYREDSPNVANGTRLTVEWVDATVSGTFLLAVPPDNFFAQTLGIIGRNRRTIQPNTVFESLKKRRNGIFRQVRVPPRAAYLEAYARPGSRRAPPERGHRERWQ